MTDALPIIIPMPVSIVLVALASWVGQVAGQVESPRRSWGTEPDRRWPLGALCSWWFGLRSRRRFVARIGRVRRCCEWTAVLSPALSGEREFDGDVCGRDITRVVFRVHFAQTRPEEQNPESTRAHLSRSTGPLAIC